MRAFTNSGTPARVAARDLTAVGPVARELRPGDLAVVTGWWSGDCLYVKTAKAVLPAVKAGGKER